MKAGRVKQLLDTFTRLRILVLGDLMLDHWVWGAVSRISPEAPVPVVDVQKYTYTPGGAANVVSNLRALGAEVSLVGVVGADDSGRRLKAILKSQGVDVEGIVVDRSRPTTLKTRIIAHSQQVVRADFEQRSPLSDRVVKKIESYLDEHLEGFDAIFLSDYDKGLFRSRLGLDRLAGRAAIAGPKPDNLERFAAIDTLTLNAGEAAAASGLPTGEDEEVCRAGRTLLDRTRSRAVLVTRGEKGMTLFRRGAEVLSAPALASQVYDVSGAGDTVLTLVGLCMGARAKAEEAIHMASHAAAVVVRKIGTATVTPDELRKSLTG